MCDAPARRDRPGRHARRTCHPRRGNVPPYLEPATYVEAASGLPDAAEQAATDHGVPVRRGTTWTTDAFFRETVPEVEYYAAEDVLSVEMEAAALFAVAEYRGVRAAALFAAFDCLTADEWRPRVDDTEDRLERLYPVARDALRPVL